LFYSFFSKKKRIKKKRKKHLINFLKNLFFNKKQGV
ncbi:hypothetical protein D9Q98_010857, partial (mitochondrion) [Chlorella vulgaris]